MDALVKKSLASCVSGLTDGVGKKAKAVRRKSAPCCYSHITYDSSWIRAYQAELHRERFRETDQLELQTSAGFTRLTCLMTCDDYIHFLPHLSQELGKLRQGVLAQKKADRTVLKAHYRNPHRYTNTPQDRKHLKTKSSSKNDDSLFGAFQGLSLNMDNVRCFKPAAPSAEQCKVM